ncbi:hypothetical protein [Teredinibacter sp. KSP-S5-2]|uniref:hypothetical protein n=1 Tax=Teredinibacter sp. KSP-S5-2 TaxID=3034506 RepID=UPI002934F813|nr:hypothetical protein [Teredinibacter sp. KSP-S5-2]WNO08429.1 hypothetical protein P5V12_15775 [Teredinibacter sp. KSP-S5-2]
MDTVNITGIGLCSSLGGYKDACAAYRAGLNRFAAHDHMQLMFPGDEEPSPLTVAAAPALNGYADTGRTIKMLQRAYGDLLANLKHAVPGRVAVLLALPDPYDREIDLGVAPNTPREEYLRIYLDSFVPNLLHQLNPALNQASLQTVFGDRLAFARILQKAKEILANAEADHCLLMISDSLLGAEDLELQLECDMLKTADNPVGYIPGEGAAIILVSTAGGQGGVPMSVDIAMDRTTFDINDGDAEVESWSGKKLFALYEQLLPEELRYYPELILDINGQENRAMEYGMLQVLLKTRYPKLPPPEEHIPALGFGEVGAMMGALALITLVASVERQYARQCNFLISLSEDSGRRALIRITV